jgi:hypothetical protein
MEEDVDQVGRPPGLLQALYFTASPYLCQPGVAAAAPAAPAAPAAAPATPATPATPAAPTAADAYETMMADLDDNNDEGGDLRDTLARSWSEMDDDFQHKKFSNIEDARDAVMAQVMALSDEDDGEESQEELALPSEDELARYWTRMGIEYRRKHFDNTSTSKTRKMNGRYCTKHGCYCSRTQCSTCLHDQLTLGQFIDTCAALKFRFALGAATQQRQQRQHNTRRHKEQRQQRRQQGQLRRLAAEQRELHQEQAQQRQARRQERRRHQQEKRRRRRRHHQQQQHPQQQHPQQQQQDDKDFQQQEEEEFRKPHQLEKEQQGKEAHHNTTSIMMRHDLTTNSTATAMEQHRRRPHTWRCLRSRHNSISSTLYETLKDQYHQQPDTGGPPPAGKRHWTAGSPAELQREAELHLRKRAG